MINKIRRWFGWLPIEERQYHTSFEGCIHNWNWKRFRQCPRCARSALGAINWALVDEKSYNSLEGIIRASKE